MRRLVMRRHRYIFLPVCLSVALAVSAGSSPARMSAQAGSAEAAQAPGYSFAVDGRKVIVGAARGGQSYEFTVRPAGAAHFKDEATPKKPGAGAPAEIILQGCAASSTEPTLLEGIVVDGSLSVTNPQGKRFQAGADFTVERGGTAIAIQPAGAAASEPRLIAEYSCWLTRMDSIVVDKTGAVKLVEGTESKSAPDLPAMAEDETAIANILVRGDRQTITPDDVLEVRSEPVAPTCRDSLRQYVDRLKAGGTVKFGFLGDSVTGGSSASSPLLSFPRSFHTTMQEKFPGARVQSAVFAIPGAKSYDLLPMIGKFLNDERPDLLFVEFVNDLGVSRNDCKAPTPSFSACANRPTSNRCSSRPTSPPRKWPRPLPGPAYRTSST